MQKKGILTADEVTDASNTPGGAPQTAVTLRMKLGENARQTSGSGDSSELRRA